MEIIYAVKTYALSAEDLTIKEVKIGRTSNTKSTMAQYNRSHRDPEILDLWKSNENLEVSKCEKGVLKLAERYAHERRGETFRFLQDGYEKFSNNVNLLLLPVCIEEITKKKQKMKKKTETQTKKSEQEEVHETEKIYYCTLGEKSNRINKKSQAKIAITFNIAREEIEKYKILKGSTMPIKTTPSFQRYPKAKKERKKLVEEGVVEEKDKCVYVFKEDYVCKIAGSPSSVAITILGTSANGKTALETEGGIALKDDKPKYTEKK